VGGELREGGRAIAGSGLANGGEPKSPAPGGVAYVGHVEIGPSNPCDDFGMKIGIDYQLVTASGEPLQAAGYVFEENLYARMSAKSDPSNSGEVPFEPGWHPVGGTPQNRGQTETDSAGRFRDAPVGQYWYKAFTYIGTQELRAVGPSGNVVKLGTTKVTVTSDSKGHGTLVLINKKMKIKVEASR